MGPEVRKKEKVNCKTEKDLDSKNYLDLDSWLDSASSQGQDNLSWLDSESSQGQGQVKII